MGAVDHVQRPTSLNVQGVGMVSRKTPQDVHDARMGASPVYPHSAHPACLASLSPRQTTDSPASWAATSLVAPALHLGALYAQQATTSQTQSAYLIQTRALTTSTVVSAVPLAASPAATLVLPALPAVRPAVMPPVVLSASMGTA